MKARVGTVLVWIVGGVGVLGAVFGASEHNASERRYQTMRAELDEVRKNSPDTVERILQPQIVQVVNQADEHQAAAKDEGAKDPVREAEPEPSTPNQITSEEYRAARGDTLRSSFIQEHRDPSWSADTERKVSAAFSKSLPQGSQLKNVECRSSMCMIEMSHKTLQEFQAFVGSALMHPDPDARFWGPTEAFVDKQSESGEVSVVVALGRQGRELPQ